MSKVYNYMLVSVGLTFLLHFAGIPSGADAIINWLGIDFGVSIGGLSLGSFFSGVAALFVVGTGTGIAIGFITKSPTETFIVAPIALGIFTVITSTFVSIINYSQSFGFVYYLVWLIFVPWLVAFGVAIIQFWRGAD